MAFEVDPAPPARSRPPAHGRLARLGLDLLVGLHLASLTILAMLLGLGPEARQVAPLAGGAFLSLGLLACLYARWLLPMISFRQACLVVALREIGLMLLGGLFLGAILLLRWLL
jgi:hypothetical protein